jgi:hypothetical protein
LPHERWPPDDPREWINCTPGTPLKGVSSCKRGSILWLGNAEMRLEIRLDLRSAGRNLRKCIHGKDRLLKRRADPANGLVDVVMFLLQSRSIPDAFVVKAPIAQFQDCIEASGNHLLRDTGHMWEHRLLQRKTIGLPQSLFVFAAQ